jgi:hypothetical protein
VPPKQWLTETSLVSECACGLQASGWPWRQALRKAFKTFAAFHGSLPQADCCLLHVQHAQPCMQGLGDAACLLCMLGAVIFHMLMSCVCCREEWIALCLLSHSLCAVYFVCLPGGVKCAGVFLSMCEHWCKQPCVYMHTSAVRQGVLSHQCH